VAKTILVVDDDADIRNTIKLVLEKNKFNVVAASSANECLEKLGKFKVDLILLDIMMPGMSVARMVKDVKTVKVIYVTAVQMSEAERKELMKQKNVIGYIQKPFDIKDLVKEVKNALEL
jgi:DNA-binding response OmpR family regulator